MSEKTKKGQAMNVCPFLWSIADSNRLPRHCQCRALPDELIPRCDAKVIIILKYGRNLEKKILPKNLLGGRGKGDFAC